MTDSTDTDCTRQQSAISGMSPNLPSLPTAIQNWQIFHDTQDQLMFCTQRADFVYKIK